jgi:ubiquinone/menaquinone biosynthesis C-methylase UbiE
MPDNTNDVREFFDEIADSYGEKYSGGDAFHEYFFTERLHEATRGVELAGRRILDIGAGTGNLYDHLLQIEPDIDYYGTDISPAMLDNSNIPADRRYVGKVEEINFPVENFDLVFMLGVTSYMNDAEVEATFARIYELLGSDGRLIVTFTNAASLDWKSRRTFKFFAGKLVPSRNVLGQSFTIYPRRLDEVEQRLAGRFVIEDTRYLNHTIFPLNQLFKRPSVRAAKTLHSRGPLNSLSSDFLLVLRKI